MVMKHAQDQLAGLFGWWFRELRAMLPERLRESILAGPERLLLEVADGSRVSVAVADSAGRRVLREFDESGGQGTPEWVHLVRAESKARELVLVLPDKEVLTKTIELPLAVEENLGQVLAYEMDRHTPFKAAQVYHGFSVVDRRPAQGRLCVRLQVVPRPILDAWLEQLAVWGVSPDRVMAGLDPRLDLLPRSVRRGSQLSDSTRAGLTVGIVVLVIAIAMAPLWYMRQVVVALNHEAGRLEETAREVQFLQTRHDDLMRQVNFLVDRRHAQPYIAEVVDELARIFPDGTWVESLNISGSDVSVSGVSESASGLIQLIESSPLFEGASFAAPVTRHPTSGGEAFRIAATIRRQPA